jgi:starvation-inducible DNA-binding protein
MWMRPYFLIPLKQMIGRGKTTMNNVVSKTRQAATLRVRTPLSAEAARSIGASMNAVLADVFALYVKCKNFHWHMSGPHFRDYHLMLDEHGDQLFAMTDPMAERVRKLGETTMRSIGDIARRQTLLDNDAEFVTPDDMLAELREDNMHLAGKMRELHGICEECGDIASASLLETWVDEGERRAWFLFETTRRARVG